MQYIADSIPSRYFYLISNKSSAYDQIVALQGRFKPSAYEEQSYCLRAYEKVCHGPKRSQDIKKWIEDFEAAAGSCIEAEVPMISQSVLVHTFLKAIAEFDRIYTTPELKQYRSCTAEERETLTLGETIDKYLLYLAEEGTDSFEKTNVFATLQGVSNQQKNKAKNSARSHDTQPYIPICICKAKHRFYDCPYVDPRLQEAGWFSDPEIVKQFDSCRSGPSTPTRQALRRQENKIKQRDGDSKPPSFICAVMALPTKDKATQQDVLTVRKNVTNQQNVYSNETGILTLRNSFIADTGADTYVCNNRKRFRDFRRAAPDDYLRAGNTEIKIEGFGTVDINLTAPNGESRIMTLLETAYISDFMTNIVSLNRTANAGLYLNQRLEVLENREGIPFCKVFRRFKHWLLEVKEAPAAFNTIQDRQQTAIQTPQDNEKAPTDKVKRRSEMQRISTASVERWHQRMGYLHDETIHYLHEAIEGVEISFKSRDPHCETCLLAKPIRQISRRPVERSPDAWDKVHFDLIKVSSAYNGNQWIGNFIDDATGWRKVYTAPNKNALVPEIKSLVKWIKTHFNKTPKTFVCNNEQTLGREFILFCKDEGITILHSARYTPEQNGFIERGGGIITSRSRSLMINSRLPVDLWPHAVKASVYLLNRTPTKRGDQWTTPFERLYSKKPRLSGLHLFGCRAYVRIHRKALSDKMTPRAWIGYLVGFTASNLWKIWSPQKRRIYKERDVIFNEDRLYDPTEPFLEDIIAKEVPVPPGTIGNRLPARFLQQDEESNISDSDDEIQEVVRYREAPAKRDSKNNQESSDLPTLPTPETTPEVMPELPQQDLTRPSTPPSYESIPGGFPAESPQRQPTEAREPSGGEDNEFKESWSPGDQLNNQLNKMMLVSDPTPPDPRPRQRNKRDRDHTDLNPEINVITGRRNRRPVARYNTEEWSANFNTYYTVFCTAYANTIPD
ncbi:GAG-pre-integrase domain-containing protein [Aspergillus affinis]|uniref:GAG-pre-integrase domain-containing protein n=1 Tax=Aspergillus affinis TaxID=1070780 RepID=UPI0022FE4BFB|nr:uncharacterized protein KD926_010216 [Aspergillus affinis]KAI9038883.1 hypothetical protein KD926_010216 [Aspergillus affinis]